MANNHPSLETNAWRNFDFVLFGMTLAFGCVGIVAIYSANLQSDSTYMQNMYLRQMAWFGISVGCMLLALVVNYQFLERLAYPLYFIGVASLILVKVSGKLVYGSQRWLSIGGLTLQPSEFMKIIVIIFVARILAEMEKDGELALRNLVKPLLFILVPFVLVAKQPDLGTALIYIVILSGIAFFNGIKTWSIIILGGAISLLAPTFWFMLKPYQKNRILTLLDPEADPLGQGYHIIQSKIAVGSGGLLGKGIFEGTQSKLNFLPEKHTDFIFSVVAEEVGFVGSIILGAFFFFFVMRIVEVAVYSRDRFGALLVAGVGTMIAFNFLYNTAMTLGICPIVGVPLPFISYGGSALLTNAIGVGLVLNVSLRRSTFG